MVEPVKDPFGSMTGAAIGMHELLCSLIDAGFTREEGMQILTAMTASWATRQGM